MLSTDLLPVHAHVPDHVQGPIPVPSLPRIAVGPPEGGLLPDDLIIGGARRDDHQMLAGTATVVEGWDGNQW